MEARRRGNDKFRLLAAKKKSTENSIPSKTILPIRKRNEDISNTQKLRQFIASGPPLQEMLKGVL